MHRPGGQSALVEKWWHFPHTFATKSQPYSEKGGNLFYFRS